jgi:hypothetical protein
LTFWLINHLNITDTLVGTEEDILWDNSDLLSSDLKSGLEESVDSRA